MFICWGGEKQIEKNKTCDGIPDCQVDENRGIASDESTYECHKEGKNEINTNYYVVCTENCNNAFGPSLPMAQNWPQ